MTKIFKVAVVALLVLSVVALVLGIKLFSKREILTGRAAKLTQKVGEMAQMLEVKNFDTNQLQDYAKMDTPLEQVRVAVVNLRDSRQDAIKEKAAKEQESVEAKQKFAEGEARAAAVQAKVEETQKQLDAKTAELVALQEFVRTNNTSATDLQKQIETLGAKLEETKKDAAALKGQNNALKRTVETLQAKGEPGKGIPPGLTGKVLISKPEWNFVVLNMGGNDGMVTGAELLVNRKGKLVGKVRVGDVADNIAVAEILSDWTQAPIAGGDDVFF